MILFGLVSIFLQGVLAAHLVGHHQTGQEIRQTIQRKKQETTETPQQIKPLGLYDSNAVYNKRTFDLHLSLDYHNPDCFSESYPQILVNHQHPSPAIHVVKNDIVRFRIYNSKVNNNQSAAIHIHGIRQYGSNDADGVPGVTQLEILPGHEFTQQFQVLEQTGTYYYHAHIGVQDDSVQGPFIVYENEASLLAATSRSSSFRISEGGYEYDEERILQWTEYWHQSGYDRHEYIMSKDFIGDEGPDSILLNGKTVHDTQSYTEEECDGFSVIDVEPNRIYRFRIISSLTFRFLDMFIQDHDMVLIEVDGEYIKPHDIKYLEMSPGQRVSVLVQTGEYPDGTLFPIATKYIWHPNKRGFTDNGYGYLRYSKRPRSARIMKKPDIAFLSNENIPDEPVSGWVTHGMEPLVVTERDKAILEGKASKTIHFNTRSVLVPNSTRSFEINGRIHGTWGTSSTSLLDQISNGLLGPVGTLDPKDNYSSNHQTYVVGHNEIIDLVFQNHFAPEGVCVPHPWHIHGYSHYLIAEGSGLYQHEVDKDIRNFETPVLKDVTVSYPAIEQGITACGWAKVRIFTVKKKGLTESFFSIFTDIIFVG